MVYSGAPEDDHGRSVYPDYFTGEKQHSLDEKGRVVLPVRYRDRLAAGVIVTKSSDRCAAVYPRDTYMATAAAVMARGTGSSHNRGVGRTFFASASEEQLDRQGRLTIPPSVRTYAGLSGEVVVIGAGDRLEIWDINAWQEYQAHEDERFANLEEESPLLTP